jgi:putative addiction module component
MSTLADKLASEIRDLPDVEKLRLVDAILTDLDKPDPEIDRIWADEARKRWAAYKAGPHSHRLLRRSNCQAPPTMNIRFLSLADGGSR